MLLGEIVVLLLNLDPEMEVLNFGAHPDGAKLLSFRRLGQGWHCVGCSEIPASREEANETGNSTHLSSNSRDQRLSIVRKRPHIHCVPCVLQGRERTTAHLAWLTL